MPDETKEIRNIGVESNAANGRGVAILWGVGKWVCVKHLRQCESIAMTSFPPVAVPFIESAKKLFDPPAKYQHENESRQDHSAGAERVKCKGEHEKYRHWVIR